MVASEIAVGYLSAKLLMAPNVAGSTLTSWDY